MEASELDKHTHNFRNSCYLWLLINAQQIPSSLVLVNRNKIECTRQHGHTITCLIQLV